MTRRNGFSEKWLELRLAAALKDRGLPNFHMSSPALPGIPDRYVMGASGLWIEVKQGETFQELVRGFDRQRTFLTHLMRGGDKAMVCALMQPNSWTDPRLFLEPWHSWLRREKFKVEHDRYFGEYRSPLRFSDPDEMTVLFDYFANYVKDR